MFLQKEFIKANYAEETAQDTVSLANQNLTSLKSPSSSYQDNAPNLVFNKEARKELLKTQSKYHLKKHRVDIHSELKCHKPTYRAISTTYKNSPYLLTRNKLYSLIYLGLLIIKDKIQLGDLLRLIREGHVSYNSVMHFFPEEFEEKNIDLTNYLSRKMPLTHYSTRQISAKIVNYLGIARNIPVQNLVVLCERYCHELNLPKEIFKCSLKLMAKTTPVMLTTKHSSVIPNYEARAISFIIFTMKLLFGLDDVTEHKFSQYALIVNNLNEDSGLKLKKMFVFDDWMKHLQYRKCVLNYYHFPTGFANDQSMNNVDQYSEFLKQHVPKFDDDEMLSSEFKVYNKILFDVVGQGENIDDSKQKSSISLTPIRDCVGALLKSEFKSEFLPVIKDDYSNTSVDFLLRPYSYLKLMHRNNSVVIKHRGANKQMRLIKIQNHKMKQYKRRMYNRKWITVKIGKADEFMERDEIQENMGTNGDEIELSRIIKAHKIANNVRHKANIKKVKKLSDGIRFSQRAVIRDKDIHKIHYNPWETYWLSITNLDRCGGDEGFEDILKGFPHSFVFLLEECARILNVYKKHLLEEFMYLELYMCYVAKFCRKNFKEAVFDEDLKKLINKAKSVW